MCLINNLQRPVTEHGLQKESRDIQSPESSQAEHLGELIPAQCTVPGQMGSYWPSASLEPIGWVCYFVCMRLVSLGLAGARSVCCQPGLGKQRKAGYERASPLSLVHLTKVGSPPDPGAERLPFFAGDFPHISACWFKTPQRMHVWGSGAGAGVGSFVSSRGQSSKEAVGSFDPS